jgi:2'-5' RNA ligase
LPERLFFALWPGEDQRGSLARVQRGLAVSKGRPVHPQDIHVTLVFLGQVPPERRGCVERAAGQAAAQAPAGPFELVLDRIGCFPRARVLWCGADLCPPPLAALVASLTKELETCGFSPERRPYRPHATLVRKAAPLRSRPLEPPVRWPVEGFVLVASRDRGPPRYEVLSRWGLMHGVR